MKASVAMTGPLFALCAFGLSGCATSQDVAGIRQDLQKEMHDVHTKYDQALSQAEVKRKVSEEVQTRLLNENKTQDQAIAGLTSKLQDLRVRQEAIQKDRNHTQVTNVALRDTILRALKLEQSELQQRLKKMGDYIKEIEQTESTDAPSKASATSAPEGDPHSVKPLSNAHEQPTPTEGHTQK